MTILNNKRLSDYPEQSSSIFVTNYNIRPIPQANVLKTHLVIVLNL